MYLTKQSDNTYIPTHAGDKMLSDKVKVGEEIKGTRLRNIEFHRKAFALIKLGFENQDKYQDATIFRQVVTMKAGFINWIKDKDGKPFPLPKSLAFENMGEDEFIKVYEGIREVIAKEILVTVEKIENELPNYY